MKAWPLRWQITLWAAVFTGLAVSIFGGVVAYNLYGEQVEVIDGELASTAGALFERGAGVDLRLENSEWFKAGPHRRVPLYGYAVAPAGQQAWTHVYPAKLGPAPHRPPTAGDITVAAGRAPVRRSSPAQRPGS